MTKIEEIKTSLETTMFMAYMCGQNNKTTTPDRNFKSWFEENKILDSLIRICEEYATLPEKIDVCKINSMGMELERWSYKGCVADFGLGEEDGHTFATLYTIESETKRKGYATSILAQAKKYYEGQGMKFGGSVALNDGMRRIYKKLNIEEYD